MTRPTNPYDTEGLSCAVLGNKGAGKSNTLMVMAEGAHGNFLPFICYDINGDAASLTELGDDVILIGRPNNREKIRRADYPLGSAITEAGRFVKMVLEEGYSLVVDMSRQRDQELKYRAFSALLEEHYLQAEYNRTPVLVAIDEAHNFAPERRADEYQAMSKQILRMVASDGRKRGMASVIATQRATYLDKAIIFGANLRIFGKCTWWDDYKIFKKYVPASFKQMRELRSGQVFIMSEKNWGLVQVRRQHCTDLGETPAFAPRKSKTRPSKRVRQMPLPLNGA
jgi:DNA helicase HerA-like ATPase